MTRRAAQALRLARARPALGAFLLAVAALPVMTGAGSEITPTDVLVGVSVVLVLITERERLRKPGALEAALLCYVAATAVAALFAADRGLGLRYTIGVVELAVLALLALHFARDRTAFEAMGTVVALSALVVGALAILALLLFYTGVHTGLLGPYGEQFSPSSLYARVRVGFTSPPLLGSWCIFASAVVASPRAGLSPRWRLATQVALGLSVALTFSRAIVGFAVALVIRSVRDRRVVIVVTTAAVLLLAALTIGRLHVVPAHPSQTTYVVPDPGNRREAIKTAFRTFERDPLTGLGPGSLPGRNGRAPFKAHFTPLNVVATAGVFALIALGVFLVVLWRRRPRPTDIGLWSGVAGLAFDGLTQDIEHFRHVWLLLGLTAANTDADAVQPAGDRGPDPSRIPADAA